MLDTLIFAWCGVDLPQLSTINFWSAAVKFNQLQANKTPEGFGWSWTTKLWQNPFCRAANTVEACSDLYACYIDGCSRTIGQLRIDVSFFSYWSKGRKPSHKLQWFQMEELGVQLPLLLYRIWEQISTKLRYKQKCRQYCPPRQ